MNLDMKTATIASLWATVQTKKAVDQDKEKQSIPFDQADEKDLIPFKKAVGYLSGIINIEKKNRAVLAMRVYDEVKEKCGDVPFNARLAVETFYNMSRFFRRSSR